MGEYIKSARVGIGQRLREVPLIYSLIGQVGDDGFYRWVTEWLISSEVRRIEDSFVLNLVTLRPWTGSLPG
jgi:hypothetical protein